MKYYKNPRSAEYYRVDKKGQYEWWHSPNDNGILRGEVLFKWKSTLGKWNPGACHIKYAIKQWKLIEITEQELNHLMFIDSL